MHNAMMADFNLCISYIKKMREHEESAFQCGQSNMSFCQPMRAATDLGSHFSSDGILDGACCQVCDQVVEPGQISVRHCHSHPHKPQLCRIHRRHLIKQALSTCTLVLRWRCPLPDEHFSMLYSPYDIQVDSILQQGIMLMSSSTLTNTLHIRTFLD